VFKTKVATYYDRLINFKWLKVGSVAQWSEVKSIAPIAMESPQLQRKHLKLSKRGLAMGSGTQSLNESYTSASKIRKIRLADCWKYFKNGIETESVRLQKISTALVLLLISFTIMAQPVIPERPQPPKLVNDFADILKPNEERQLERRLVAYNDSTSTQMTVVTVKSLGGEEASFFAFQLGEKWGVGQSEENNGLVILIAPNDRKAFIATGYGTEGAIPDAYAKRIVEDLMIPQFKTGNYFKGIVKAVEQLSAYLRGEEFAFDERKQTDPMVGFFVMLLLFVGIFFLFGYLASKSKANGYTYSGKGVKPFGKGSGPAWGGGTWTTGGGGFGSGGGFGGGSSSGGGGFGGFGGGSFGGGGAGGSW